MSWCDWIFVRFGSGVEASPIEIHDDGTADIVVGLAFITDLDGLKERPEVQRIYEVDDIFEGTNPRLFWERPVDQEIP